jgi:protoporphyrinogen oxidase
MVYDDIVIGAGISGLSYAYFAGLKGRRVLVIEKKDQIGGTCQTFHSAKAPGFWLELGAHTLYNSYPSIIELITSLDLTDQVIKREKKPFNVCQHNKIRSIFSYLNLPRFALGVLLLFFLNKKNQTVSHFYKKVFGKKNYERILANCFSAVLSQDASDFPAEFLFNRKKRDKNFSRSFTLSQGLKLLFDRMLQKKNFQLFLNESIETVKKNRAWWQVVTTNGIFESRRLIIATGVKEAKHLIKPISKDAFDLLDPIKYSTVETFAVICHKKALIHLKEFAGLIGKDAPFYSVISRDVVNHRFYRGFVFHFKPDIFQSDEEKITYICQLLKITDDEIVDSISKINRVPILKEGHKELIQSVEEKLKPSGLLLTGNYFSRLALEDCARRSFDLLAQK